ncbi:IS256 family transposase [Ruminococcus sp. FC2018]|uniref:IS256 family transposase n=1 Tax=Ruminococcus sp. FC2018 TaxID=1410617 RepID=UPI00048AEF7F|nr:IS256 family transposase [Ruminococcus sp. FC2018]
MARRKREPMSEGKKNIIGMLLEEYDIKSAKDIEDALKDLLGGTIQEMLESEMDEHLGYQEYERSDNPDSRNGKKTKKIRGNFGETEIEVPQDRDGSFEPKVVKKRQKDISGIEQKIISLYAKGMTTRQISETIEDIYGFEVSDGMVSDITDRLLPQIEDWQKRPLDEVYPIVFVDAVHFSVRENGQIRKLAAYVILAVSMTGHKEVLSIHIGENESAKYWLGVLNDLKTIYHAPSEDAALEALDRVTEKWEGDYPNAMKSWYKNWDVISPIFKFSSDVRKVIYTTNAIESLNSGYRRLNKQRSVFPSDTALLKVLYLATHEIAKKWTMPLRNWGKVLGELEIMYPDRLG